MNYRELDVPCFSCNERYAGCHGKCEKYAAFVAKNEERKEKAKNKVDIAGALTENTRKQARRSGRYLRNVFF